MKNLISKFKTMPLIYHIVAVFLMLAAGYAGLLWLYLQLGEFWGTMITMLGGSVAIVTLFMCRANDGFRAIFYRRLAEGLAGVPYYSVAVVVLAVPSMVIIAIMGWWACLAWMMVSTAITLYNTHQAKLWYAAQQLAEDRTTL